MSVIFDYFKVTEFVIPNELTHFANATSSSTTITMPTGVEAGDIAILIQSATIVGGTAPTDVNPSGFTALSTDTGALAASAYTNRTSINYKILDGTEDGSTLTGMTGGIFNDKYLIVFRPNFTPTSVSVTRTYEATDGDPTSQNITVSGSYPMVFVGLYGSSGAISTRTFSPAEDAQLTRSTASYCKYKVYNSSASATSVDMPDAGSNVLLSARFNVS